MPHTKTQSILIIDDHVENLSVLSNILKPYYRIRAATNGREAITLALATPAPDLILLDIMMPEMDGYEVCERLKANPKSHLIPIIFLTARTANTDEARGFAVGAVDYVTKPVQPLLLLARVRAQLALAALLQHTHQQLNVQIEQVIKVTRQRDEHAAYAEHLAHEIMRRERAENALRDSQARFERLTTRLKDQIIFFSHSVEGELLYCSDGVHLLDTQILPAQLLGENWITLAAWTAESLARIHTEEQQLLAGDKLIADFEIAYHHTDGGLRHFMVHEYLIQDPATGTHIVEGIAFEMTAKKAQDTQLRTLVQAVEQASASIVISDATGTVLYVNPYFSMVTGYTKEEIVGQNPRLLKSGEHDNAFYGQMWNTLISGQTWRGDIVNRRKNGELFWESAAISPIIDANGLIANYVAVKEDINERKKLERIKQDVEQIMRHDLKSPLNAIIGIPQVLNLDENLTPSQRELIGLIQESGTNMLNMIDLSLDLFKIETGRYQYQPEAFNLLPLLTRLIHTFDSSIQRKQVNIHLSVNGILPTLETKVSVTAESRLVFSMLSNLLLNAIEAAPIASVIQIELVESDPLLLSICNSGTVPVAIRADFFQKYKTYGKRGGTGLGTYSAKLMADVMGFDIGMDTSDLEQKTRVLLKIPAVPII
ncbi:response regulator [Chromatium okenii]|uniref:response regulator n=1 Tax=Chromatium okenii TaxID=61644 RepID=UPI00190366B8|nr:response regulator [Chromatium okenii]